MSKKKPRPRLFERLKTGLEEIILHADGKLDLKSYVIEIPDPPPTISSRDVVALRNRLQVSEVAFASLLNVPVTTLRAWESGKRRPTGAAARLIQVYGARPDVVELVSNGQNGMPLQTSAAVRAQNKS